MRNGITGARIPTSSDDYVADEYVEEGVITAIGIGLDFADDERIDAAGVLLLPGAVDPHTQRAYGFDETATSDDYASGTIAAAPGVHHHHELHSAGAGHSSRRCHRSGQRFGGAVAEVDFGRHPVLTEVGVDTFPRSSTSFAAGMTSTKMFMAYRRYVGEPGEGRYVPREESGRL